MSIKFDADGFTRLAFAKAVEPLLTGIMRPERLPPLPRADLDLPPGRGPRTRKRYLLAVKVALFRELLPLSRELVADWFSYPALAPHLDATLQDDDRLYLFALDCAEFGVQAAASHPDYAGEPGGSRAARRRQIEQSIADACRTQLPLSEFAARIGISRSTLYRHLARKSSA